MYARPAGTFLRSRRRARAGPRLRSATRGLLSESLTGRREELVCSSKSATSLKDPWRLPTAAPIYFFAAALRFAPAPEQLALVNEHSVVSGDRLDNLASTHFGDAELYWRICDANGAVRPDELTETVGRRLRITMPAGVPGVTDG